MKIRRATAADLGAIGAIYAHYVQSGVATFELNAPDSEEWARRLRSVTERGLPFLVATLDDEIAGYAYCAPWKERPAYLHTVEDSVYVAPHAVGRGVGGQLLDALMVECERGGIREIIAVVVATADTSSLALHRNRGFTDAGRLKSVGFKHGQWLDTILLQRSLVVQ